VATRNVEKGKSVGRSPVNEEIVEYLCQPMLRKVPKEVITSG
jgi:hypothetical protein